MATGRRGAEAYADAHRLVEKLGLRKLADAGEAEILEICRRMSTDAIQRLMAGVEIGLRIAELKTEYGPDHGSPVRHRRFGSAKNTSAGWHVTASRKNSGLSHSTPRMSRSNAIRLLSAR
jgi:hypothetical protein